MVTLLVAILVVASVSLAFNVGYIVHELGIYPHTKDRSSAADRTFSFQSRYERGVQATHSFQVMSPDTAILRRFGHAEVYGIKEPYEALETVIRRYQEHPTRARYDDLVHVANHVCNKVRCDERVDELMSRIHVLMHTRRPRQPRQPEEK
jgi:hypothetical protein